MISPGICQHEIKLQAFMLKFMFMQTLMFRSACTVCQLQWLVCGVFNSWTQWSDCHFQPKWCYDCMDLTLMKNKTKPQGLEERCSVCVTASGCRFSSQLYRNAACVASRGGGKHRLAVSASQSNRNPESLHRAQVCVYQCLADNKHMDWRCTEEWCLPHICVCVLFGVLLVAGWLSWIEQSPKGVWRFKGHS